MEACSRLVKTCSRCETPKLLTAFYYQRQRHYLQPACRECAREVRAALHADPLQAAKRRQRSNESYQRHKLDRLEMIEAYGGTCVCCGETRPEFLSIDHIFNDGAEERASDTKWRAGRIQYVLRDLGYPRDRYQLLCFNCNIAKHINGECPHVKAMVLV